MIMSINISPDQKEMIVGTLDGKIYRVLTSDLSFLLHTDSHGGQIVGVSFGQKVDKFLTIDDQGVLKYWDLNTYKPLISNTSGKHGLIGTSSCIALDDGSLITGWNDGSVRCFNPEDGKLLWELNNAHK